MGKLVLVAINSGMKDVKIKIDLKNTSHNYKNGTWYLTTSAEDVNMLPEKISHLDHRFHFLHDLFLP
ncbi:hypothetical protein ACFOG5_24865 [Pedobacter fastidiosus]|uniref:hypothetical protein n=1 Tax=Pedobacter fastidiosus TaxID=2765361 RepID=UPI00360F808A